MEVIRRCGVCAEGDFNAPLQALTEAPFMVRKGLIGFIDHVGDQAHFGAFDADALGGDDGGSQVSPMLQH